MNQNRYCIHLALTVFVLAAGCSDPAGRATRASSSTGLATSAKASGPTPTFADTDLAVPEDFELDARKTVTTDSYRSDLAAIAKEIDTVRRIPPPAAPPP